MKRTIHKSHRMGKSYTDVRSTTGTPRFYSVQQCKGCGAEEIKHAAGQFTDYDLAKACNSPSPPKKLKKTTKTAPSMRKRRS